MRDHRRLKAFQLADALVIEIYRVSNSFPRSEAFGLTAQMRRASVSVASNLVEGCTRRSEREFLRFVDIALGSAKEVCYQLTVVERLGLASVPLEATRRLGEESVRILSRLRQAVEQQVLERANSGL